MPLLTVTAIDAKLTPLSLVALCTTEHQDGTATQWLISAGGNPS
jgi:hypothetical protein